MSIVCLLECISHNSKIFQDNVIHSVVVVKLIIAISQGFVNRIKGFAMLNTLIFNDLFKYIPTLCL